MRINNNHSISSYSTVELERANLQITQLNKEKDTLRKLLFQYQRDDKVINVNKEISQDANFLKNQTSRTMTSHDNYASKPFMRQDRLACSTDRNYTKTNNHSSKDVIKKRCNINNYSLKSDRLSEEVRQIGKEMLQLYQKQIQVYEKVNVFQTIEEVDPCTNQDMPSFKLKSPPSTTTHDCHHHHLHHHLHTDTKDKHFDSNDSNCQNFTGRDETSCDNNNNNNNESDEYDSQNVSYQHDSPQSHHCVTLNNKSHLRLPLQSFQKQKHQNSYRSCSSYEKKEQPQQAKEHTALQQEALCLFHRIQSHPQARLQFLQKFGNDEMFLQKLIKCDNHTSIMSMIRFILDFIQQSPYISSNLANPNNGQQQQQQPIPYTGDNLIQLLSSNAMQNSLKYDTPTHTSPFNQPKTVYPSLIKSNFTYLDSSPHPYTSPQPLRSQSESLFSQNLQQVERSSNNFQADLKEIQNKEVHLKMREYSSEIEGLEEKIKLLRCKVDDQNKTKLEEEARRLKKSQEDAIRYSQQKEQETTEELLRKTMNEQENIRREQENIRREKENARREQENQRLEEDNARHQQEERDKHRRDQAEYEEKQKLLKEKEDAIRIKEANLLHTRQLAELENIRLRKIEDTRREQQFQQDESRRQQRQLKKQQEEEQENQRQLNILEQAEHNRQMKIKQLQQEEQEEQQRLLKEQIKKQLEEQQKCPPISSSEHIKHIPDYMKVTKTRCNYVKNVQNEYLKRSNSMSSSKSNTPKSTAATVNPNWSKALSKFMEQTDETNHLTVSFDNSPTEIVISKKKIDSSNLIKNNNNNTTLSSHVISQKTERPPSSSGFQKYQSTNNSFQQNPQYSQHHIVK